MAESIELTTSTVDDPFKFFKALFETNLLDRLRDDFMPSEEEGSWIMGYPHSIDRSNEKYTIEYQIEKSGHEEKFTDGHSAWIVDEYEWVEATFSFEEFLVQRIERELLQSKLLFTKIAQNINHQSTEEPFRKYLQVQSTIKRLFAQMLPDAENLVGATVVEQIENQASIPSRGSLSPAIFDAISVCTDQRGEELISYHKYEMEVKPKTISSAIENIFLGYPHRARIPIYFNEQWPKMSIYYLLGKLSDYSKLMNLKAVEASAKVYIGSSPFKANNAYSNYLRFKDERVKLLIDKLFEANLLR